MKGDSGLHRILNQIQDLNLKLMSVNQTEKNIKYNQEGKNMKTPNSVILACIVFANIAFGQNNIQTENTENFRRHYIGSSAWMIYDKFITDPADYYQLSYGYHYTPKDVLFVEAITWKYDGPLGTYYDDDPELYPGKIRSYGIGFGYQRFLWKNLFVMGVATPFLNQFYDEDDKKIQKGFQLYTNLTLGYRFEFFNKRFFIEPAWTTKFWPVNTNLPDSFQKVEDGTPKYVFEPSTNIGFRF